jgi:nitroreductase
MNEISILNQIIENRRSIFPQQYTGERVDDAVVKKILENANWAPTHRLTEPWRFFVYTKDGLKTLAVAQANVYKHVTQADGTFKEERYQNLLTKPLQSSHIIVVALKRDERRAVPDIEEVGAVFCAIQNMHLTATAYGVGAYLSTGGITYFEEAKEVFGLDQEDKLIGFFNIGMPAKVNIKGKRTSIDEKVLWYEH